MRGAGRVPSRGAATDVSPRRKPWVGRAKRIKPRQGRQKIILKSRHLVFCAENDVRQEVGECVCHVLTPLRGSLSFLLPSPRLAPWATFLRRSASGADARAARPAPATGAREPAGGIERSRPCEALGASPAAERRQMLAHGASRGLGGRSESSPVRGDRKGF